MRLAICVSALLLSASAATAQAPVGEVGRSDDIGLLSDEFEGPDLVGWSRFDEAFGWANKIKQLDVGRTTPGALHLEPYHSAWVRDRIGPFLFREVRGDFDVRTRIRVSGADGPIPGGTWSLSGLMARVPNRNTAERWAPRAENWHFITTGVGHVAGEPMIETKSTFNSYSSLKLRPAPTGWMELRLVKVGVAMVALARPEGQAHWQVRDRYYRMEPNPTMQVGLIAYTTSDAVPPGPENPEADNRTVHQDASVDMMVDVDWVRFSRPRISVSPDWYAQVSSNPLADPNLTEADLLALIGD